ncbi:MAG TPA: hypothetical protein VE010_08020, partial [Thermoanaerobaculia bacterium]|nr:hypothetical protein [Thermoanaerobaculia bacterium]
MFVTAAAAFLLASTIPLSVGPPGQAEFGERTGITVHDADGLRSARSVALLNDRTPSVASNDEVRNALIAGLDGVAVVTEEGDPTVRYVELKAEAAFWLGANPAAVSPAPASAQVDAEPTLPRIWEAYSTVTTLTPQVPLSAIRSYVPPDEEASLIAADVWPGDYLVNSGIAPLPPFEPAAAAAATVDPEPALRNDDAQRAPSVHWRATLFRMDCQSPAFCEKPTPASEGRCERPVFVRVKMASMGGVAADRDAALRDFA